MPGLEPTLILDLDGDALAVRAVGGCRQLVGSIDVGGTRLEILALKKRP